MARGLLICPWILVHPIVSNRRNQPFSAERVPITYEIARGITSQADDNLVPICDRARNDLYGSKRSLVLHARSGATPAAT
jgi:hypothetical protein